jgi:Delta3-Delta2-enoyl-CoA isomerase
MTVSATGAECTRRRGGVHQCVRSFRSMDGVRVVDLGSDENPINPDWIDRVSATLDEVVAAPPPRALVTTASGRFFSIGFDVRWMADNPDGVTELVASMHDVVARLLELPVPTVAAIPRHALAGGALFALAHDYRVMREDRGYWCLPEVDIKIAFTPGLTDLVRARLAPQVAHEALTSGRRYSGPEAVAAGIADAAVPAEELLPRAQQIAGELAGKDPDTYGAIKATIYRDVLASLRDREANYADIAKFEPAFPFLGLGSPDAAPSPDAVASRDAVASPDADGGTRTPTG